TLNARPQRQGPLNRHRKLRNSVVAQSVFPAHPGLRFVEGYQIDRIDPHPAGVEIKLLPVPKKTQRHVDQTPDPLPRASIRIHFKPILSEIWVAEVIAADPIEH